MRRQSPTLVPDMQHKHLPAALVDVVVHTEVSHSQSIRRVEFATHSLHTTPPLEGRFHGEHLPHDAQDRPTMKHADRIQLPYRLRVDHHSEHVTFVVSNVSQDKVFETGRRRCPGTGACSQTDRKSTRLNSSHQIISYAVFCLKKKTTTNTTA